MKRTRKEREGFLIKEFLTDLGYTVTSPKWTERPDAFVTVEKGDMRQRIGIEHTDYFNDTFAGRASPLSPMSCFWQSVQASLIRRISHRKHLTGLNGRVRLKQTFDSADPRKLAEDLVAFAESHPVKRTKHTRWTSDDFPQNSVLNSVVDSLLLSRITEPTGLVFHCDWACCNLSTGGVCLSVGYIKSAVRQKNTKALNYSRGGATALWLLIVAAGDRISNHAGPRSEAEELVEPELMTLCQDSPFDRIVFWERIDCWYKWLKPNETPVQYRNPYIDC